MTTTTNTARAPHPLATPTTVHARIDVHHHAIPTGYRDWLRAQGINDAGGLRFPPWAITDTLAMMDANGIATAILSIPTPGVHLGNDAQAREKAREVNEFTAGLVNDRPDRFGFFATLTLPDVDGALAEAAYAFDELGAAGVILLTNVHGRYLGDPQFDPLMAELNRRRAVVFTHPEALPGPPVAGLPPSIADFLLDTTRAAMSLVRNGVVQRYPQVKFILSHAGGFLPYAARRIAIGLATFERRPFEEVFADLRHFYFDTALSSPSALPSLLAFAQPGHVLFGSDWPFAHRQAVDYFTRQLDAHPGLDPAAHTAINHTNAAALLPDLKPINAGF